MAGYNDKKPIAFILPLSYVILVGHNTTTSKDIDTRLEV
jgi:hypothetical protein